MPSRLLLVEDEPGLQLALSDRLASEGYQVETAGDGNTAIARATGEPFDIIILDVMLPGRDGFDVARTLRQRGIQTPILMLTARGQVVDRVVGLKLGADDYLTKPFDFAEVLARLRALLRRGMRPPVPDVLRVGSLELDTRLRRVTRHGKSIPLTTREYALLEYLARRAAEFLGRAEIAEHVWDDTYEPFSNVIDVYIRRLRRKIDEPGEPSLIETRRGEGYALMARERPRVMGDCADDNASEAFLES